MKRTDPPIHLLDPNFRYVPASQTDLRATFAKFGWFPPRKDKDELRKKS